MTMREFVGETFAQRRVNLLMFEVFAALALLLAAAGVYSVLAYTVRQRVKELGIRLALGASMRNVLTIVLSQGLKPALAGIGAGLLLAIALGRAMESLVYGVSVRDLATYVCAAGLLLVVAFVAGLVPALRATRIEPLAVLRDE
jgi:ABC-type antimicrobial peptide transport system permease subunit